MSNYAARRAAMVENQLRARGIWDERVLAAMATVPREEFVPRRLRHRAYVDSALPIGGEQTISQPWIVAAICQELALSGPERVLEVGTGSGYSAAVLALLAAEVISIERDPELSRSARRALAGLGVPVIEEGEEMLVAFHRHGDRLTRAVVAPCRFVPLVGEGGFAEAE